MPESNAPVQGGENRPEVAVNIVRPADYDVCISTGFMVRPFGRDTFLIDPFLDLPPIHTANVNDKTAIVVERRLRSGFVMSREEMRNFGQRLIEAADQKTPEAPKQ